MANSPFVLNIEMPCNELWSQMSSTQRGRFCQSCSKEVLDLTGLTDEQVLQALQSDDEDVCIRARVNQLDRDLYAPEVGIYQQQRAAAWISQLAAACIAFAPMAEMAAYSPLKIDNEVAFYAPDEEPVSSVMQVTTDQKGNTTIKGVVYSSWGKQPVHGVQIAISDTKYTTTTNDQGEFTLTFALPSDKKQFTLICRKEDYSVAEKPYNLGNLPQKLWVEMHPEKVAGKKTLDLRHRQ